MLVPGEWTDPAGPRTGRAARERYSPGACRTPPCSPISSRSTIRRRTRISRLIANGAVRSLRAAASAVACSAAPALAGAGLERCRASAGRRASPGSTLMRTARSEVSRLLREHPDYARWLDKAGQEHAERARLHRSLDLARRDPQGQAVLQRRASDEPTPTLPGFPDMERRPRLALRQSAARRRR